MKPEEEGDKSIEFCEETQTIRIYHQEESNESESTHWIMIFWGIITLIPMVVLIGLE